MKNILTISSIIILIAATPFAHAQWQQTNGPRGGYVTCYANNDDEIYVGTEYGGVFRSTNNGANWTARNNGLKSYDINCIAVDNDNLYVGTRMGGVDGVYHSSDDGATWENFPTLWTSYEPFCIAASGENVYVGTAGGGNFFSHDGGASWSAGMTGILSYQSYTTLQILILGNKVITNINGRLYESLDGGVSYSLMENGLLAGTQTYKIAVLGEQLFVTTSSGLYISDDEGNLWNNINALLPDDFTGMSMSTTESFIYITIGPNADIYFSNNNGFDWTPVYTDWGTGNISFHALSNGELLIQSGYYSLDYTIFEAPQLHYSDDNGNSWADVTNEITSTWCLTLTSDGNNVYAGTQFAGMYQTSDEGDTWYASAIPDYWVSVGTLSSLSNTIMASGDGGVLRSDDGETWTVCNQFPSIGGYSFAQVGTDIFAANWMDLLASTDDGQNWSSSNNGLEGQNIADLIAIDNVLYALSTSGVYISDNFGNSWSLISSNFPIDFFGSKIGHIGDVFFVTGANSNAIYKSTDGCVTWTSTNLDTYGTPSSFVVYEDMLFVSVISNITGSGVFMTPDLGDTWVDVSEGLDNNQVWDVIVHNNWAYACTKGSGVYKRPLSDFLAQNTTEETRRPISIYPNPAKDMITIDLSSQWIGSAAMLTNELGQHVMTLGKITTTPFQFDCSSIAPGFYVLQIGTEKVKLVVE